MTLAGGVACGISIDGNLWLVDRAQLDQPSPAWQQQTAFVQVLSAAPAATSGALSLVVLDATAKISVADRDGLGAWSQPRVIASNVMARIPIRTCQVGGGTLLAACDISNVLSAYFSADAHTWNAVPPPSGAPAAIRDIALSAGGADAKLIALDASGRLHYTSFSNGAWQAWVTAPHHPNGARVWAVGARIWIADEANHLWQTTDLSTWTGPGWAGSTLLQTQPPAASSGGMRLMSAVNDGTWGSSSLQLARVVATADSGSGGRLRWNIAPQANADVLAVGLQSHPQVRRVQRDTEGSPPQASGSDKLVFRPMRTGLLAPSYVVMGLPASTPSTPWSSAPTLVTAQRVPAEEPANNTTEETKFRVQARSVLVWRPSDSESDKAAYRAAVATAQAYVTDLYNSLSIAEVTWDSPAEVAGTAAPIGIAKDANGFLSLNAPAIAPLTPLTPSDRVNIVFSTAWDISAVTTSIARGVTPALPSLIGDNLSLAGLLVLLVPLRNYGYTVAHELGHFLGGLPHVTDAGSNNLMIPTPQTNPSTTPTITPDQVQKIQGSPNVVRRDFFLPLPPPQRVSKLRVVVQTGSDGTDQNVFIDILSSSGSVLFSSELASFADNFESGHTDAFSFELDTPLDPDALRSAQIRFDRSALGVWVFFGTFLWDLHALFITGYAGDDRICDFSNVIDRTLQPGDSVTVNLIPNM